jgi:hypothetical protein
MNVCDADTQVCVDLPPPSKWECVERTPALPLLRFRFPLPLQRVLIQATARAYLAPQLQPFQPCIPKPETAICTLSLTLKCSNKVTIFDMIALLPQVTAQSSMKLIDHCLD